MPPFSSLFNTPQIVYISAGGGWKEDGAVIGEINMAQDYERMVNRDYTGAYGYRYGRYLGPCWGEAWGLSYTSDLLRGPIASRLL